MRLNARKSIMMRILQLLMGMNSSIAITENMFRNRFTATALR